jgi:mevalonate kinase
MAEFFSRGKLILMGEYAVMDGAAALCIPLETGQQLSASETGDKLIHWSWTHKEKVLAQFTLDAVTLRPPVPLEKDTSQWATKLLQQIRIEKRAFLAGGAILEFKNLFPPEWGLGSSSATISSLCRMADADPFRVNKRVMGGSGADIAASVANKWYYYQNIPNPVSLEIEHDFTHKDKVFFIYSGKKQATAEHLTTISRKLPAEILKQIEEYARQFASGSFEEVLNAVQQHEQMLAGALGMTSRADSFNDFKGRIKSLGAWGGDFFMAVSPESPDYVREYFRTKGFNTIFSWDEMTKTREF